MVITFCHCYSVSDLKQKRLNKGLCNPLSNLVPHKNPILLDIWQFLLDSGVVSPCLVFSSSLLCEQPQISLYHCEVKELFPNIPGLLGGEFSGFKTM